MKIKGIFIIVFLFSLFIVSQAFGFSYSGVHWPGTNPMPEPYLINPNCHHPEAGTQAEQIAAINNGATTWNNDGKAKFSFTYGEITTKQYPDDGTMGWPNDYNEIMFVQDPDYWLFRDYPYVGAAVFYWYSANELYECDMAFNDLNPDYIWNGVGLPTTSELDIWNAAAHEFGHFLQLNDLYDDLDKEKTMYGILDYGESKKRDLDPDDIAGIQFIYGRRNKCGDVNGDDQINLVDVIYLANYILKNGPSPVCLTCSDVNADTKVNLVDVIYLANYILKNGPSLVCP